jgi:hypothetical protein
MEILALAFLMAVGLPLIMAWIAWTDDSSGHSTH